MKRLLALLLLAVMSPAFAQEQPPPVIYDPTIVQTYTPSVTPTTDLQNINQNGGTPLTLYDDGSTYTPIDLQFEFYYFGSLFESVYISQNGFISFTSNANGCCSGNQLPFLSDNPYYNMNNSIFAMWSDLADFNNPGNPYYLSTANSFTVGWYGIEELGSGSAICDEFGCQFGSPNKFNFEITLLANSSFSISYGSFDYNNSTGRMITSGYQGDTSSEYYTVYFGNDPTTLEGNTYTFASNASPPPPPEEPDPPIAPDCTVNPNDPTCIINALIPDTTTEELVADETTGSDDGSSDGTEIVEEEEEVAVEEEMLADAETIVEETLEEEIATDEESLEEMLAEESEEEEEVVAEERILVYRELSDEEKSKVLEDAISKNTLEAALSIAADVVSSATAVSSTGETVASSDSSSKSTTLTATTTSESAAATTESIATTETQSETTREESADSSSLVALEILDTGRQLGQEALANTLASSESSANDSVAEAQSIAAASSGDAQGSSGSVDVSTASIVVESNVSDSSSQTVEQIETETASTEQLVVEAEQSIEIMIQNQETQTNVDSTSDEQAMEMFAGNISQQAAAAAEQEELENNIVQQAIAASQTNEEETKMGFAEAEAVTIASDPALVNAFNIQPNAANLELLGVLGSRAEEKSDAEIRAEQVVAANKEQQDAINANYMDADQSGIVAAIGSEADVSSYLSQRLTDVPFYKPEDIYKNIVIKDNVRGSYFLEKGNTDTYKKMVEEQYK